MYKRLLVISDTAICKDNEQIFGFASVVKELEFIEDKFEKIVWIGTNSPELAGNSTLIPVTSKKIKVILIPKMGGKSVIQILQILVLYPYLFLLILKNIFSSEIIHTRAPSHPAFIGLLWSFLFRRKIWWHKFAGSWDPISLPFFYKLQRNVLLKANHSKVSINGFWPDQPEHCLSFENPCLTETDIANGIEICKTKSFAGNFTLTFIGRLDDAKGMTTILESLQQLDLTKIYKIHFIGDSNDRIFFEKKAAFLKEKAVFHGFLSTEKVHQILENSHFILLPSKSEGFPKVIAEAACYGVIPAVSDVGSISHYINATNGFVWQIDGETGYESVLKKALESNPRKLEQQSKNVVFIAKMFTFENYRIKLQQFILSEKENQD